MIAAALGALSIISLVVDRGGIESQDSAWRCQSLLYTTPIASMREWNHVLIPGEAIAKSSPSGLAEGILVIDCAEHIQPPSPDCGGLQCLDNLALRKSVRRNDRDCGRGGAREGIVYRQRVLREKYISREDSGISGGRTAVYYTESYDNIISGRHVANCADLYVYVSSELSNSGVVSAVYKSIRGAPQKDSCNTKNYGENGDDYGCERCDRSLVFVSELPSARSVQINPLDKAEDEGATLLKGFILMVVFGLLYALAKYIGRSDKPEDGREARDGNNNETRRP
jgi:hypothetical protein